MDVGDEGNARPRGRDIREVLLAADAEVGSARPGARGECRGETRDVEVVRERVAGWKQAGSFRRSLDETPELGIWYRGWQFVLRRPYYDRRQHEYDERGDDQPAAHTIEP